MSTLTLVRHGQAEPFQREGSVLTRTGEAQAAALARWWLAEGIGFDEVYTGALARQTQTQQIVAECFRQAGRPWPEACPDASWNEYDAPGVLAACGVEGFRGNPDDYRRFQRAFEAAMIRWMDGAIHAEGVELWPAFRRRVAGAIERLMAGPPSRSVAVFTSGGPIGFSVHFAAKAPPRTLLELNWRIRNTSLTHFVFDRERFSLDTFNSIPHLTDPGLRTYR